MRRPIRQSVRFRVLERDNFTCRYCGSVPPNVVLHVDHVVPVAEGGSNDESNLVTACADCNIGKRARVIAPVRSEDDLSEEGSDHVDAVYSVLSYRFGPDAFYCIAHLEDAIYETTHGRVPGISLIEALAWRCVDAMDFISVMRRLEEERKNLKTTGER